MARDRKKPVTGSGSPSRATVVTGGGTRSRWRAALRVRRNRALLAALAVLVLLGVVAAGYMGWRYYDNRKKGIINASTYAWPTTEKGTVRDRIGAMSDQQKAEYFYGIAFEYKNTNKLPDAKAAVAVSLQYRKTVKALVLAGSLAESARDYTGATNYYQQLVDLLGSDPDPSAKGQADQYKKRIEDLRKLQQKPPAVPPAKSGSEVGA